MRPALLLAGLFVLLSACVSQLPGSPQTQSSPTATPAVPKQLHLTTMSGTSRTITVVVPSDVCSADDYLGGFLSQYVYTWNMELNAQVASAASSQRPRLADARLRPPAPTVIPPPSSQRGATCAALAASKGQTAGSIQAHNDLVASSPTS
jgi:hypothetical protein